LVGVPGPDNPERLGRASISTTRYCRRTGAAAAGDVRRAIRICRELDIYSDNQRLMDAVARGAYWEMLRPRA